MTTRKELSSIAIAVRSATFSDRIRILDEFVALTGYHRKHAIRLLRQEPGVGKGSAGATGCMTRRYAWR